MPNDTSFRPSDPAAVQAGNRHAGMRAAARLPSLVARVMLRNPILPILLVALPAFALFVPFYATPGNLANLLLASSILLLLTTGGALVMITGNIDLSVEGTLAFTSMAAAWLMVAAPPGSGLELSPFVVIPITIGLGVAIGAINAFLVEALGVNPFIVTIGMLLALKGAAAIPTGATTVYGLPDQYSWVGLNDVGGLSWIVIISFVICLLVALWLRHSIAGRHLYAIGGNKIAAHENGVFRAAS